MGMEDAGLRCESAQFCDRSLATGRVRGLQMELTLAAVTRLGTQGFVLHGVRIC